MDEPPTASVNSDPDRRERSVLEFVGGAPGDEIGPYVLLELIGEGGFGSVWVAERRQPFTQRVALKLIKPGRDTKEVLVRFEQERQTLAVLDHPHVAKVLDGGMTQAGRPYFAMELVKGKPVTEFCDDAKLSIRKRLELFLQICEAVQHAHIKGIVHRDLKPSNILVSLGDEDSPFAKVIDFGIAKMLGSGTTGARMFTGSGELMGTPEYMSPEQADPDEHDIDTRSDVYSLGVVLYELLVGQLPFSTELIRTKDLHEIRRFIREVDPVTPSSRVTSLANDAPETLARLSALRREQPARLAPLLRRELEWIPLKAMRKDRRDRYASVADLSADVRAYLAGLPLQAAPESAGYRVRKFARRNAPILAAIGCVLIALSAGLAASIVLWREAAAQGARAQRSEVALRISRDIERTALEESEEARRDAELRAHQAEAADKQRESEYARAVGAMARLSALERRLRHISPSADRMLLRVEGRWALRDAQSGAALAEIHGLADSVSDCCWSPDGALVAVVAGDGSLHIYDSADAGLRWRHLDPNARAQSILFTNGGSRIVSCRATNGISVHDAETGAMEGLIESPAAVVAIQTDEGGNRLIGACSDWRLRVWDLETRELLWETGLKRSIAQMGRVADRIFGMTRDGEIVVFEDSGRLQRVLDPDLARVAPALVEPPRAVYADGRRAVDEELNASIASLATSNPDVLEFDEITLTDADLPGSLSFPGLPVLSALPMPDREIADSLASLVRLRLQIDAGTAALAAAQQLVNAERGLAPDGGIRLADALALRASAHSRLEMLDEALMDAKQALELARQWLPLGDAGLTRFEQLVNDIEDARLR